MVSLYAKIISTIQLNVSNTVIISILIISIVLSFVLVIFLIERKKLKLPVVAILAPVVAFIPVIFSPSDGAEYRLICIAIYTVSLFFFSFLMIIVHWLIKFIRGKLFHNGFIAEKHALVMNIPISAQFELDEKFARALDAYVEAVVYLSQQISVLTLDYEDKLNEASKDEEKIEILNMFFLGFCTSVASLFDDKTRVHIRRLYQNRYEKLVASYERKTYNKEMKILNQENKMIEQSFKNKCSLIRLKNPALHEDGNNDRVWKNYLMFSLPMIVHKETNRPVFTVGISIKREENDLFYFLNYVKFEEIINAIFDSFFKNCQIQELVNRVYYGLE